MPHQSVLLAKSKSWIWLAAMATSLSFAQTQINLPKQSRDVDFSNAPSTKPAQTGTALPANCSTGQMFLSLSSTAGQNVYVCTSTNVWSLESGGSGSGSTSVPSFNVTTTSTAITMGPGAVLTAANGVSVLAGSYTITHVSGSDNGTFRVGPNANNQPVCYYSAGITLSNWSVAGFSGATCTAGSPPVNIYTVAIPIVTGVVQSAPAQYQPVTNQALIQGADISITNNSTIAFAGTVSNLLAGASAAPGSTGCSASVGAGSTNLAGYYSSGTTGTCTVVLTWAGGAAYTHGGICKAQDLTTVANAQNQTGYTQTTTTLSGTTASGDMVLYSCQGF